MLPKYGQYHLPFCINLNNDTEGSATLLQECMIWWAELQLSQHSHWNDAADSKRTDTHLEPEDQKKEISGGRVEHMYNQLEQCLALASTSFFSISLFACWFQLGLISQPTMFFSHNKPAPVGLISSETNLRTCEWINDTHGTWAIVAYILASNNLLTMQRVKEDAQVGCLRQLLNVAFASLLLEFSTANS